MVPPDRPYPGQAGIQKHSIRMTSSSLSTSLRLLHSFSQPCERCDVPLDTALSPARRVSANSASRFRALPFPYAIY